MKNTTTQPNTTIQPPTVRREPWADFWRRTASSLKTRSSIQQGAFYATWQY